MTETATESDTGTPAGFARRLQQAVLVAAITALGYLGMAVLGDASVVLDGLRRLQAWQWLALLALSLLNYALRFMRWHLYLGALGARVPWWQDLRIYIAGFGFTVSPGKAGEAVRSVYLRDKGVPWSQSLATLTLERILDLAAVVMLAALAIRVFADYAWAALAVILVMAAGMFAATRPAVIGWLAGRLPQAGRIGKLAQGTVAILNESRQLLAPSLLLTGLLLGVVAWSAEAIGFWLLLGWLGLTFEPLHSMGIYAVGMLAGALSFLPGGVGGAEAAMVALVMAGGATLSAAILATVICRAATLWFAVLLGIVTLLSMSRR